MNESKVRSPRVWEIWRNTGAVGSMDDAKLQKARGMGKLPILGIGEHYSGPAAGKSTISLGEKVIWEGDGMKAVEPVISVIVNGHGHPISGEMQIPHKAKPVSKFFPNETSLKR